LRTLLSVFPSCSFSTPISSTLHSSLPTPLPAAPLTCPLLLPRALLPGHPYIRPSPGHSSPPGGKRRRPQSAAQSLNTSSAPVFQVVAFEPAPQAQAGRLIPRA
jgi:hypothetical protein